MDPAAVDSNQPSMEIVGQPADLTVTRIQKCPKPFSIESIISTNDNNKNADAEPVLCPPNYEKVANSNVYFPSMAAATASLYNPWFHNYFIQQQKVAGNVLEMMQLNTANQSTIKEKFSEIFANNPITANENRTSFLSVDHERNLPPTASRHLEQYFGGIENIHEMRLNEMISNNDYYKHLSSYGVHCLSQPSDNLEQCKSQLINGDDAESNFQKNDKDKLNGLISDYEKSARNDDSGPDENVDDDIDSDCNSEISLDMSPDGDNNTQGNTRFQNPFVHHFHSQ